MSREWSLCTEQLRAYAPQMQAGDRVLLSGTVYTARDAAHKRLCTMLRQGEMLPFALRDACVYYAGPTPTPPGAVIGSCGPTTSGRMDVFTPLLLEHGLGAMIGKGPRSAAVCRAIEQHNALYFCAVGGAGALAAQCITQCEEIAFFDLGCESIKRLMLQAFPLVLAIDACGGSLFGEEGSV